VIADVDGPGYYEADGLLHFNVESPYQDYLLGIEETSEACLVRVGLGRTARPNGKTVTVDCLYRGCGYVVASEGATIIDDGTQLFGAVHPSVPVPFFRRVWSAGQLEVMIEPSIECIALDRWHVFDGEARKKFDVIARNQSKEFPLESTWPNDEPYACRTQSFLNGIEWTQPLPPNCCGLRLERTFDQFHGRQRARVLIDGEFATWWYDPSENRRHRWNRSECGVGQKFVAGKPNVRICLDPPAGVALWNMSEVRVYALVRV
jgi:hypothetical protein